jgi:low molecular weight phosphotyrosine protein phosphatase
MAEGIFRNTTHHHQNSPTITSSESSHPLIHKIDSCGTDAYHVGDTPDPRTLAVLKEHHITNYTHQARKFKGASDFKAFDYIFAMDRQNEEDLLEQRERLLKQGKLRDEEMGEVMLFGVFGVQKAEEVKDPYYGGRDGFTIAYEQLERFSKGFIKMLEEKEQA